MASERFSLTVLPVSVDPARVFHVSLHIAPRLAPSAGKDHLGDFPLFSQWGITVTGGAKIHLFDQSGQEIACTPLWAAIEPRLWPFVFPARIKRGRAVLRYVPGTKVADVPGERGARRHDGGPIYLVSDVSRQATSAVSLSIHPADLGNSQGVADPV